jgi:prolycopene isomerase
VLLHVVPPFPQVGTPRTHRRYLSREDGTYGPIPSRRPLGMLSMPFNTTSIPGLYCVGDSTFPGQVRGGIGVGDTTCPGQVSGGGGS